MARVTDAEVKEIIETTLDTVPFIETANLIVNEDLEPKGTLSEERLKQIELYLSAHFVAVTRERQLKSEEFGDAKDEFLGEVGKNYEATLYGQQAIALDSCGVLATQGNAKARFEIV